MDSRNRLEELELTTDEINRLSKALQDEKFRQMLHEYAEEISNPQNKKKYEEEITQLERERGMDVQFVHPKPHHVLKTSLNGKVKCFINICSNNLIGKPTCEGGVGEDGKVGQYWSLPYSLAPGRSTRDAGGNKFTIYDVVFHPDTLDTAGKDARFMELVNSTAVQGVEEAFKVQLDKLNAKVLKIQYKGVPHPAVIRRPIPGDPGKEKANLHKEPSPFCYPDIPPNESLTTALSQGYPRESSSAHQQPTKPRYTIKYRSVVDLQNSICCGDSTPGLRPKDIIITIDLPLIKRAGDIDLNVTKTNLALTSQKPDYKLELQLSYPVDDDKGDAKFNKAKKQLTITLPVLPAKEPAAAEEKQPVSDDEERDERESVGRVEGEECAARIVPSLNKDEENNTSLPDSSNAQCLKNMHEQIHESGHQFSFGSAESKSDCLDSHYDLSKSSKVGDALWMCEGTNTSRSEENSTDETEDLLSGPKFTSEVSSKHHTTEQTSSCSLRQEDKYCSDEPAALSIAPPVDILENIRDCPQRTETPAVSQHKVTAAQPQMIHGISVLDQQSHVIPYDLNRSSQQAFGKSVVELSKVSSSPSQLSPTTDKSTKMVTNSSPDQISATLDKDIKFSSLRKEVNLPLKDKVESLHSEQGRTELNKITPALLREKNPEDRSEVIISDHATSAAFTFQNSLWFELD